MVATPLVSSSRFIPPGTEQYYFCTTIANKNSPLRIELDAGTDLTGEVAAVEGFATNSESVEAPDLKNRFTPKVSGRISSDDSSLSFYRSTSSNDVRSLLPRDTVGFVVRFPEGDVAGRKMDVFPVTVASAPKDSDMEAVAKIMVQFTITGVPAENVTVPA